MAQPCIVPGAAVLVPRTDQALLRGRYRFCVAANGPVKVFVVQRHGAKQADGLLGHGDPPVRRAATTAPGRFDAPAARRLIAGLLQREHHPAVRRAAEAALRGRGGRARAGRHPPPIAFAPRAPLTYLSAGSALGPTGGPGAGPRRIRERRGTSPDERAAGARGHRRGPG